MSGTQISFVSLCDGLRPSRKTRGAAGFDCYSRVSVEVPVGSAVAVPLGFSVELPEHTVGLIVLRSSAAKDLGLFMPGGMGIIDEDYSGEVHAILSAMGSPYTVDAGERIVQMVVVPRVAFEDGVQTERRGGFGSTGR